jgi:hypothetical protein
MEAARTSEKSVDIQLRTWQYIPEDSELHTRHLENLKSQTILYFCILVFCIITFIYVIKYRYLQHSPFHYTSQPCVVFRLRVSTRM